LILQEVVEIVEVLDLVGPGKITDRDVKEASSAWEFGEPAEGGCLPNSQISAIYPFNLKDERRVSYLAREVVLSIGGEVEIEASVPKSVRGGFHDTCHITSCEISEGLGPA